MKANRLLRLADHLDNDVARKDFDFTDNEKCAMGHATRLPYFKRLGLKYDPRHDEIVLGAARQVVAAVELFGVSHFIAESMFMAGVSHTFYKNNHPTPKQVAKAIRTYVKTHDKISRNV